MATEQPLTGKIYDWLQNALNSWQNEGIINPEQAALLQARYRRGAEKNWLTWVIGLLAAFLIGGGVILLLAYNWYDLGHFSRALIALLPLWVLQGICLWLLWQGKAQSLSNEVCALLLGAAQGAAVALISQTYHLSGALWQFLSVWLLMMLPAAILLRARVLFVMTMCYVPAILLATPSTYIDGLSVLPPLMWQIVGGALLLAGGYAFCFAGAIERWAFLPALLAAGMIWLIEHLQTEQIWFYLALCYVIGLNRREDGRRNALRLISACGLYLLPFYLLFDGWQKALPQLAASWFVAVLGVLVAAGLYSVQRRIPQRLPLPYRWLLPAFPFYLWGIVQLPVSANIAFWSTQLYILLTALLLLAGGLATARLLITNAGLVLLITLFLIRFLDSYWSLLERGIGFIACGLLLFGVNLWLIHRRKTIALRIEPLFGRQPALITIPGRRRLFPLLLVIFLLQSAYVVNTLIQAELTLHNGTVYRFKTRPVDPYDPFRGRYVRLRFALEDQALPLAGRSCADWQLEPVVYGVLSNDAAGFAKITRLSTTLPQDEAAVRSERVRCNTHGAYVILPFSRFYTNELLAPELEKQARRHADSSTLLVRIRGKYAVPERLEIGGKE